MLFLPALAAALFAAAAPSPDALFEKWNSTRSPGCAVGVLQDGKVLVEKGYGMASLEYQLPITARSRFYLGSTSKEFTALTVLQLAEQGRLSLDDSIRRHFRQLPAYTEAVKVRHLLEHTSGIRDYIGLWTINGAGDDTPLNETQVFRLLERQSGLNFAPGNEFLYSNSGYF